MYFSRKTAKRAEAGLAAAAAAWAGIETDTPPAVASTGQSDSRGGHPAQP